MSEYAKMLRQHVICGGDFPPESFDIGELYFSRETDMNELPAIYICEHDTPFRILASVSINDENEWKINSIGLVGQNDEFYPITSNIFYAYVLQEIGWIDEIVDYEPWVEQDENEINGLNKLFIPIYKELGVEFWLTD